MKKEVVLIICGAGYMGTNALKSIDVLANWFLSKQNITIRLIFIVELNYQDKFEIIKKIWKPPYYIFDPECIPPIFESNDLLISFLNPIIQCFQNTLFIVYDATPTSMHYDNLIFFLTKFPVKLPINKVAYLGEKPLFIYPEHLQYIKNEDVSSLFCEFIETVNPVFLAVKNYLSKKNLIIKEIWFWRGGSSAIKKAIEADRPGISGGALLDKSPHDFSISIALLEPEEIEDLSVLDAEIYQFVIHPYYFRQKVPCLLNTRNEPLHAEDFNSLIKDWDKSRDKIPADGLFSCDVDWKVKGQKTIKGKYLFSWIGLSGEITDEKEGLGNKIKIEGLHPKERCFVDKLYQLKFYPEEWLTAACELGPKKITNSYYKCYKWQAKVEEVRIGIIRCEEKDTSKEIYIVCNFLSKYGQLKRFAKAVKKEGERVIKEPIYEDSDSIDYGKEKRKDLAKIFSQVIMASFSNNNAKYISKEAAIKVHEAIFKAQKIAFNKIKQNLSSQNFDHWFNKALPIFNKKIKRK